MTSEAFTCLGLHILVLNGFALTLLLKQIGLCYFFTLHLLRNYMLYSTIFKILMVESYKFFCLNILNRNRFSYFDFNINIAELSLLRNSNELPFNGVVPPTTTCNLPSIIHLAASVLYVKFLDCTLHCVLRRRKNIMHPVELLTDLTTAEFYCWSPFFIVRTTLRYKHVRTIICHLDLRVFVT